MIELPASDAPLGETNPMSPLKPPTAGMATGSVASEAVAGLDDGTADGDGLALALGIAVALTGPGAKLGFELEQLAVTIAERVSKSANNRD